MVWIAHEAGRELLGEVPAGVRVEVCEDAAAWPADPAEVDFWVPPFLSTVRATDQLPKFTKVRVVQLLSAGADAWVGHVPPGVQLCDARGVHDKPVAEWVLGAAIGALRQFPAFARAQQREDWAAKQFTPTAELTGKRVLIVGAGPSRSTWHRSASRSPGWRAPPGRPRGCTAWRNCRSFFRTRRSWSWSCP
ncbi:hypothetical protein Asp14428_60400 [Actinoplanes sp. NBRC 14428]|nr:hypothetical protein Asp14428_60400 [Actinoplanes sp. NBRC 14428]